MSWRPSATTDCYVMIVRQDNNQVLHHEKVDTNTFSSRITFAGGTFYVSLAKFNGDVLIRSYTPGTSTAFATFATPVAGGGVGVHDLVPVTNGTTGRIISAVGKVGSTTVRVYQSNGTQLGSTATVAITPIVIVVEADQVDATINLYTVTSPSTGQIRTFNFTTGALTLGPTATTVGVGGSMCRLPTLGANPQSVCVAVNDASANTVVQTFSQAAHAPVATFTLAKVALRGRVVNAQSGTGSQKRAIVFPALVAPQLPLLTQAVSGRSVATNALIYASATVAHMVTRDYTNAVDPALEVTQKNLMVDTSTGKLVWVAMKNTNSGLGGQNLAQPVATMLDFKSQARRQTVNYGGLLYAAGGNVQAYDGRFPSELYFNEQPGIYSATPAAGGSLVASAQYDYMLHWEYTRADGSFEQSDVSAVFSGNTGALQTQNTISGSTPHTIRVALGSTLFGGSVVAVLSRSVWNALTGSKGSEFRRCKVVQVPVGMASYGAPLSIVDQLSDAVLATQGVVYTQGSTNSLSGPVPNNAPESCSFIDADASRLFTGGLVRPFETQVSKEASIEQPFAFSEVSSFFNQVSEAVTGVSSLDTAKLVFTANYLYALGADGPNDQGGGKLDAPRQIASPGGLLDWRSLLKVPSGVYFQLDEEKLYKLPVGGEGPVWEGVDVQDTLLAFPRICGAARCKKDDAAMFACSNVALTDSAIVVQSLRAGVWTVDDPPLFGANGIAALVNYGDLVAYASGGRVFVLDATGYSDTATDPIVCQWKTHPLYPFELGGYGTMCDVIINGEYQSAGTLALRVSYDDGANFVTYDSFILSGLAVGQTVQRKWALQQSDTTSLVLEWTFTPSAPGAGFILPHAALLVDSEPNQLRELDPSEMA